MVLVFGRARERRPRPRASLCTAPLFNPPQRAFQVPSHAGAARAVSAGQGRRESSPIISPAVRSPPSRPSHLLLGKVGVALRLHLLGVSDLWGWRERVGSVCGRREGRAFATGRLRELAVRACSARRTPTAHSPAPPPSETSGADEPACELSWWTLGRVGRGGRGGESGERENAQRSERCVERERSMPETRKRKRHAPTQSHTRAICVSRAS